MSDRSRGIAVVYLALAAIGLIVVGYFITKSIADPTQPAFFEALFANWTSTTLVIDLLIAVVAAIVWVVVEARRLRMRWPLWLLLIATTPIAFSLPLFLAFRERTLAVSRAQRAG